MTKTQLYLITEKLRRTKGFGVSGTNNDEVVTHFMEQAYTQALRDVLNEAKIGRLVIRKALRI